MVSFTKEETKKLNSNNVVYIAIENKDGEKITPEGYGSFGAKLQVVEDE